MPTETEKSQDTPVVTPEAPPAETLESVKAELEKERAERQRFENSFKTLQGTHSKTQEELKATKNLADRIDRIEGTLKSTLTERLRILTDPDLTPEDRKAELSKIDQKITTEQQQRIEEAYNKEANSVWEQAQKFGKREENELVDDIYDLLTEGTQKSLERAKSRLAKLEKSSKGEEKVAEQKTEKVKTAAEIEAEIEAKAEAKADAKVLEKLKAKGIFDTGPAANGASRVTLNTVKDYSPAGKSVSTMKKDTDAMLDQFYKK